MSGFNTICVVADRICLLADGSGKVGLPAQALERGEVEPAEKPGKKAGGAAFRWAWGQGLPEEKPYEINLSYERHTTGGCTIKPRSD